MVPQLNAGRVLRVGPALGVVQGDVVDTVDKVPEGGRHQPRNLVLGPFRAFVVIILVN